MVRRILRRTLILCMILLMVMVTLPMQDAGVYAATLSTSIRGLSASYDNGTWTASGTTLQGTATGEAAGTCSSASAQTSTLTLTNSSGSTAVLAFEYTKPSLGSGGSVTIDGTARTTAGSFSKELAANGSITVVIVSGSAGAYSSSVTLNNVSVVPKKTVTTTFTTTTGGSYTVDGVTVTADITRTQDSTVPYRVVASPSSGYKFVGWLDVNADSYLNSSASTDLYVTSNTTIRPVFVTSDTAIWEVGTKVFFDLNQAITYSSSNNINKITLIGSGTLPAGNYTIPSGKTVLIPCDVTKTVYTTTPGINKAVGPSTPSVFKVLQLSSGANITVNGAISVAGKVNSVNTAYTAVTSGPFGYINTMEGSSITIANGGKLYCWGYISGDGTVTANSGATVYEPFQLCDLRGGTATSTITSSSNTSNYKVFPIQQYYIQNIEAELIINYGATETAFSTITIQGSTQNPTVKFVGSSGAFLTLSQGSCFRKKYDPIEDRVTYDIYGSASLNNMTLNVGVSVDSAKYVLPLMEGTTLRIHSGTTTVNQSVSMLPGFICEIDNGATLSIPSSYSAYAFDRDEWVGKQYVYSLTDYKNSFYSPTRNNANKLTAADLVDVRMDVNGTINATGSLFTTTGGADITSTQGGGKVIISKTSSGTIYEATQSGTDITFNPISAVSAKLHNDEIKNPSEPYTLTASGTAGTTYTYSLNQGKWGNFSQFTVTFKNDDGTTFSTLTVTEGDTISEDLVGTPSKDGDYVFQGWFNGNDQLVFGETPITGNITYTARWSEATYTYGEPTYTWSADYSTCTATAICAEDPAHNKTETVNTTSSTTAATCETAGQTVYTATFTDELFTTQTETVVIPATGHAYGQPTYNWASDYSSVTATVICANDSNHVITETVQTTSSTTAATCEAAGQTVYTATFTKPQFTAQTETVVIPATGHDYGQPTYVWTSDKSSVTATVVCSHDSSHVITETVQTTSSTTAATCDADGQTVYTATFTKPQFTTQTETVVIPATGHAYSTPTYTWSADNSSVTASAVCANDSSHVLTETVQTTSTTNAATCESAGTTTYTATFSNTLFQEQSKTVDIPALGHDYGTPTYVWADDNSSVTATTVCSHDASHVITETVQTTSATTQATCEEDGSTVYTATFNDSRFETQTKTVVIPSIGHNYGTPTYTWADDKSSVTATVVCLNDANHVITETVQTTSSTTDATCETAGTTVYTAHFANVLFQDQTDSVTIPALGHDYGTPTYTWSEDNSKCTAETVCSHDASHVITETVDSTSVTTAATCEVAGSTVYTAEFTDGRFAKQTKSVAIPALGHDYSEPTYVWSEDHLTCTATVICSHDSSHVITETVDSTSATTPATCEATGATTYTAAFADTHFTTQTESVAIPATGHDWGTPVYTWSDDNSQVTAVAICKNNAGHVATETVNTTNEVTTPATCEGMGIKTYTAAFTNELFSTQVKDVETPATGHAYGEPTYEWTADKSSVTATVVCANDASHVVTETVQTTNAVTTPATCEGTGVKTYTATFTNALFSTQTATEVIPAIGHAYGEPTYEWAADKSSVTATVVCANDASHVVTETVQTTNAVTTPATCETTGVKTYTATFTNALFSTQTSTEVIPATGHAYGEPTYEWAADKSAVTATAVCENDASHVVTETVQTTNSVTTPATCETTGVKTYTATFTNALFSTQTETEEIPATGHAYGEPTYEWAADKSSVTATVVCANDASHVVTETVQTTNAVTTSATCETTGVRTYTATFTNALFSTQTATEVIAATGHNYGEPTYVWTEDLSSVTATAVCANDPSHVVTETVQTTNAVTTPATCEETGVKTYTATFTNALFSTQTETEEIPATGHAYGEPTYEWAADKSSVTATVVCANDASHVVTETVQTTNAVTTSATCEETGVKTYTATFTNALFSTQTATEVIAATGHNYGEPTYVWTEDLSSVTATAVCANDPSHVVTETVQTTNAVTTPATCETAGARTYTAAFENELFTTQTETEEIPATGHDYGDPVYTWAEDYSKVTAVAICKNNPGHIATETVNTTNEITTPATCETMGVRTYTASFTNELFSTQTETEEIPAIGHAYGEPTYEWAADKSSVTATAVCANDASHVVTETVQTTNAVTTSATCETTGVRTYTATFENELFSTQTETEVIPATGHNYGEPTYAWAADLSSVTATAVCTNDPSHVVTETIQTTNAVTTPATCETTGVRTYTATFENELFTTQTETEIIPATGHAYGEPKYVWTEDLSSVTATVVCANDASHVVTETVQTTNAVTTPATCETAGVRTYTATFENELFSTQTETEAIPATGHNYGEPTYVWTEDLSSVTATVICQNDPDHVITETVSTTNAVTTPATCEATGVRTYTATFENELFSSQTETEVIPATGHAYGEPTYEWAADLSSVTATTVCANDASHVVTETVQTTNAVTTPATCETAGVRTYTATFTNELFSTQTETEVIPATGHAYGEPTYEWAADLSSVTATVVCANDASHVVTETVQTTNAVTTAATCETAGVRTYTATFENELFSTQTETEEIPATGHAYGDPTYVWTEDLSSVTATAVCANDQSHVVTETVSTTNAVTTPATCETTGVRTHTATFENELFTTQTETEIIPATGHAYGEPTYEWTADLSSVTATVVCANDATHVVTETVQTTNAVTTPATCETTGVRTYTATFTNELFSTQTETEIIPAIGHAYGEPTYEWAADLSSVTATVVCTNDASHVVTETVQTTNAVTTPATCETTGVRTYTATFENELFTTQTESEVIPATGHAYGDPAYVWADDNTTVTATAICANDAGHVLTETVSTTKDTTPATCEAGGKIVYTAEFENSKFETQTKTVETPALGHTWGTPTYEWAEDNSTCTATAVCGNDPNHILTEEGAVTSAVTTEPTCETTGLRTYTATFENSKFEAQTITEVIPANGHSLTPTASTEPTCEEPGNNAYWTCEVCGKHFSDAEGTTEIEANSWIIPALGHDLVKTDAHPATCTEPGNNAYWTCTRCGKHFADADAATAIAVDSWIIPAAGHVWNDGVVTTEATCTHEGEMLYTCTVCNATRTEVIPMLAHVIREVAAHDPTCTQEGNTTYYVCDSCGHFFSDAEGTTLIEENSWIIPANGHTFGEWVVIESPTCVDEGSEQRTCTVCGFIETQNLDPNGHSWEEEYTIDQEPDCTTDGSKSRHCHNCNQVTDVTVIPALGHDWDTENVVWNWAEDYSSAEAVFTCKRDHSHVETLTAAVTAETAAGIITYTAKVVFEDVTYTDAKTENAHEVLRIYGKSRYDTCIKIADYFMERNGIDKLPAVVLATGGDFPDALTGAYLANVNDAPIMLIDASSSARITAYINNHLASDGTVYILGGKGAVDDSWIADLSTPNVKRMNGKNRYETNLSILEESGVKGGDIFVCTGTNYADSLSASGIDMPILIVGGSLSENQKNYLAGGTWSFHLVGGTSVVTADVEEELKAYGTIADRTYGSDRYATSKAMAERFVGETHEAVLAYGANFPDGLCGGPVAYSMGSAIILSGSTPKTNASGIAYATGKNITSGLVLGGASLIDDETVRTTFSMRESDEIKIFEQ